MASKRYLEARDAYEAERALIKRQYDAEFLPQPYDFSGGFVFEEQAWHLLENTTDANAAKIYEDLLEYTSYTGWDISGRPVFPKQEADNDRS